MSSKKTLRLIALLGIGSLYSACTAPAQSIVTGAITGIVTDPTGLVVAGAGVTLQNIDTSDMASGTSDQTGNYGFPLLKPGTYSITVGHDGFKRGLRTVQVLLGQTTTVNIQLQLGDALTTVEVSGVAPLVQVQDANLNTNFNAHEIQELPNPGADLSYVAQMAPGALMNTSSGKTASSGNFNIFGLPATSNLFTFNGNDLNDPYLNVNNSGASNLTLGLNDVQEVAVISNGYSGEYGRQAGAQVDFTTKSGSNQFHGNAIYNWNGSALNAQDYFLSGTPKTFENNNQWAASLGGPIKKDKAFFFVNTEGIRYVFGTASDVWVPTPAFESYVFSQIPATATAFYQKIFGLYNNTPGINRAVHQAESCGSSFTSDPVPNGACLEEFHNSSANGNREWLLQIRGDYNFSEKDKVFAQVNIDHGVQPTYTDSISPLFNIISHQPNQNAQLNYTHIFSPTILNNFVASLFYSNASFQSPNLAAALAAFPGDLGPFFDTSLTPLGTGSNIFGGYPFADFPNGRRVTQWQLVDDVSIDHGNHLFKFGVNFRRDDISDLQAGQGTEYPFIASTLADFSTDTADQISRNFAPSTSQPIAYYNLGLYFQDSYRATQKLRFTLSLRADRNPPGVCQSNCSSLPVKPFDQLNHSAAIPYNQMMDPARHQILRSVEALSFQPRLGVAWSPLGQNTVIRGGIGLFTDLYPGFMLDAWTINFPQVTSFQLFGAGTIDPNGVPGNPSAAATITSCNSVFQSNYAAGGTVDSFLNAAPGGCAVPNLNDVSSKLLNPKYVEWNLELQHTFGGKTVASINYVGNHGYDEYIQYPYLNAYDSAANGFDAGGFGGLSVTQPDSRVGFVYSLNNNGVSNYNGVTFSLQQTLRNGFSGRINYTYSHTLDDLSNGGDNFSYGLDSILYQINPKNMSLNYAAADYDVRHSLTASYVWDLPFKSVNRALDFAVGGWELSGTFFARSGFPFSVVDGNTEFGLSFNGAGNSRVQVLGQPLPGTARTCTNLVVPCWNAATDFNQNPTTFGTVARNSFRGPGYFNTDFSIRKSFPIREGLQFQVGVNAYNVLNHPNFANPSGDLSSGTFGTIQNTVTPATSIYGSGAQAAVDARIIQLMAKLTF